MRFLVAAVGLCACAKGGAGEPRDAPEQFDAPDDSGGRDAARIDARVPDGGSCPSAMPAGPHILLSEVAVQPSGHEFIEIVNPTTTAVDLSDYYLTDSSTYYKLPAGVPSVGASDFIVKFPAGATIAPAGVVTIATDTAATFMTAYGAMPTYSITDGSITSVAVNGTPTITDGGEMIALFYWDGSSSLVFDVDLLLAGVPSAINGLDAMRSNYSQLGCKYAADANTITAQASSPANGKSTKRIALETGHEAMGGNGLTGDDETSETTSTTWDTTGTFSAPTPGTVPAAIQ